MKEITKKELKAMKGAELFKLAHEYARNCVGDYKARLALFWNDYRNGSEGIVNINCTLNSVTKDEYKAMLHKKEEKQFNINIPFVSEKINNTINDIVYKAYNGTFVNGKVVLRGIIHLPKKQREYEEIAFFEGLEKLKALDNKPKIITIDNEVIEQSPIHQLQNIVITYFMKRNILVIANKLLKFGNYKRAKKVSNIEQLEKLSYSNASSSFGRYNFENAEGLYHELIIVSARKLFQENIFDEPSYIYANVFFRLNHIMAKELYRNRKFKANVSNDEIIQILEAKQNKFGVWRENNFEIACKEMNLKEKEIKILELLLEGYKKNEIDELIGQRNDRAFNKIKKELELSSGMTYKQAKQELKELKEKIQERKRQAMEIKKALQEREMKRNAILGESNDIKIEDLPTFNYRIAETKQAENKQLPIANIEMIEKIERLKQFNSKAINI